MNLFIDAHAGGKFLSDLVNILIEDVCLGMITLIFVNPCIRWSSDCKTLVNILTQDELLGMNVFFYLHLLLCELMHYLVLSL